MIDRLLNKYLPDFTKKKIEKHEAAKMMYEAGPYDWGVSYSLSSHPKSYDMMNNPQDWYLETHWGFDVIFTDK